MDNGDVPTVDVVVVGGGPAGAAAAFELARLGHSVVVAERKRYPREKTCGDGLTPRSIFHLAEMGFDFDAEEFHVVRGLRAYAGKRFLEMEWPQHPIYPNFGGIIRRADLDAKVAALAEKQGATILQGVEARPLLDGTKVTAVDLVSNGERQQVTPRIVVVADGSSSRFGRAVGTRRNKGYPFGLALRGYFASPNADDQVMESQLDIRDWQGRSVPGYGWIFPLGDGTVNAGVGLLSNAKRWKGANTGRLLKEYVEAAPPHWALSQSAALTEPVGGKLLMSMSVGPPLGPNWVVAGDAMGAINPFNGEGIAYAYETGRMVAAHVNSALANNNLALLASYPRQLDANYRDYYRVGRILVRALGNPHVMRALVTTGMRSRPLMEWVLRVMSNLLNPADRTIGTQVYLALERLLAAAPGRI